MATLPLSPAAIALNRFGLGVRPGDRRQHRDGYQHGCECACELVPHHDVPPGPALPILVAWHPNPVCGEMRLPIPMHASK